MTWREDIENYLVENPQSWAALGLTKQTLDSWEDLLTPEQKWACWCNWNGFLGWASTFLEVLAALKVELRP